MGGLHLIGDLPDAWYIVAHNIRPFRQFKTEDRITARFALQVLTT